MNGIVGVNERSDWPESVANGGIWLDDGRSSWVRLDRAYRGLPTENSALWLDNLTLHAGAKTSNTGFFTRLSMLGAADMLRGVATLYGASPVVPLSRSHFPIVRSIQEHVGQVIWLLEPGSLVSHPGELPVMASHECR